MLRINWDEFKEYKKHSHRDDNFLNLLAFIKSYYNTVNAVEIFNGLKDDPIGEMMLQKRSINEPEDLEHYIFKI